MRASHGGVPFDVADVGAVCLAPQSPAKAYSASQVFATVFEASPFATRYASVGQSTTCAAECRAIPAAMRHGGVDAEHICRLGTELLDHELCLRRRQSEQKKPWVRSWDGLREIKSTSRRRTIKIRAGSMAERFHDTNSLSGGTHRFFFFSREETRMHVHVAHPDGEAKFWLVPAVELATQTGLAKHIIGEAQQLVEDHRQEIIDAWNKHFPG